MQYKDLHELIQNSSSSRSYFLSLTVEMQMELHEQCSSIHTAFQLHDRVRQMEIYHRQVRLGGWE